jgi:pimeloyl-ACP methyl ester carboxylesterase
MPAPTQRPILFCHGLESSPQGAKVQAMRQTGYAVEAPDFQGQNLQQRTDRLCSLLRERGDHPLIVGSSYGGITALCASILLAREGIDTGPLLLCAPALARAEPPADSLELKPPVFVHILHGTRDEVVPIEVSRRFALESAERVALHEVDDDHRLRASMPVLLQLVAELL